MTTSLRHPTRTPALEILVRAGAVVVAGFVILGLLPLLLELAA